MIDGDVLQSLLRRGSGAVDDGAGGPAGGPAAASSAAIAGSCCACFDIRGSSFLCSLHF